MQSANVNRLPKSYKYNGVGAATFQERNVDKFGAYSIVLGVRIPRRIVGIVGEPGYVCKVHAK